MRLSACVIRLVLAFAFVLSAVLWYDVVSVLHVSACRSDLSCARSSSEIGWLQVACMKDQLRDFRIS